MLLIEIVLHTLNMGDLKNIPVPFHYFTKTVVQ